MFKMLVGAKERDGGAARCGCGLGIRKIIPDEHFGWTIMPQSLPILCCADFDPTATGTTTRFDRRIRSKHSGDAKRVDGAHRMNESTVKLDSVFGRGVGKWIGVRDRGRRLIQPE